MALALGVVVDNQTEDCYRGGDNSNADERTWGVKCTFGGHLKYVFSK